MDVNAVFSRVLAERSTHLAAVQRHLREDEKTIVLEMLPGSSLPLVLAELLRSERRPMLVVTAGMERAEDIAGDLEFFGVANAMHYPKWEVLPYDEDDLSLEVTAKSLDVFEAIERRRGDVKAEPFVIVATVDALMQKVLPARRIKDLTVRIKWGERVDLDKLDAALVAAGYEREPVVEARGEFSIRGGIVDVFPLNSENPIRVDLFGDEIESIRVFDVSTQRSLQDLGADAELIIAPSHLKQQVMSFLGEADGVPRLETLFDHLPSETLVVLESPERFAEVCEYFQNAVERQYDIAKKTLEFIAPPDALILRPDAVPTAISKFRRMEYSANPPAAARGSVHVKFEQTNYVGDTSELDSWITQIKKFQQKDYLVAVVCDNDGQVQRFEELLREKEVGAVAVYASGWSEGFELRNVLHGMQDVLLLVGGVQTGFALPDARLCLMTDREIFGRYKRRFVYKKIYKGKPIHSSNEIRRGDFVVHVDHGIGKFQGMRVQELDGRMVDLIEIEYANNDKLLVPVEKIHKVQKYSAHEGLEPNLDRLGSSKWAKRREKHTEEIERLAEELLQLYANRQMAQRPPHDGDTRLQLEFESSFLYQETPDQMQAIVDAKKDMERQRPMDRLVCGDVGYGKTEVAIRAIFKCVQSGRQAAVLCPTTILAQQHFNNFRERFADYQVRIEMVSRFRKPQEVKEVKARLKTGEVRVVVGTHALLAKDVAFQNLGLVVVDEEQRFGVRAKERLKEMRTEIDILTLSATPIPRTLHLALSGLRDLSLITTPPPDRQPIKTKIISFEEAQIAEAILRELNRGGQVYFVHNRVATIEEVVRRLKEIVPHAKVTHAHGQMNEEQLEETMLRFIDRQFDILVSTTIIESGVDIPNCNTIIINRADAFGLSQLYQLRGRVGREKRRAYAYLIVPQGKAITESAVKRLAAIEEFAELGVGFSIAMRDLEIRGAGDILGKAQHGAISEIGFELFCELLEERVRERRGDLPPAFHDVDLKWDANAFFPPQYIPMEAQRVTFYKRLASARTEKDLEDVRAELCDRYGDLPDPASNLMQSYKVRIASQVLHLGAIRKSQNKIRLTLILAQAREREKEFVEAGKKVRGILSVQADTFDQIVLAIKPEVTPIEAFGLLLEFFAALSVGHSVTGEKA
ncbi:transcription-repair coupling factor [Candidatus Sumerlaeota bacterium]|nr:transcription-repair coupling factor [Candidatus Sumerlaeota bacterium]